MIPAPWIYFAAVGLGVAVGVALDAWVGWPWWAGTLAVVAAVWLFFLSSAFTGPDRGDGLGSELLDVVNPGGTLARRARREAQLIRASPFPIYGLDASWSGLRGLGGVGWRGRYLTSVELTHGDPIRGPWVRIETALGQREHHDLHEIETVLWHRMRQPPPEVPPEIAEDWTSHGARHRQPKSQWTKASIPVDGELIEFDWLNEKTDWAARVLIGPLVVTVHAHRVPIESVRLAVLTDVEPYVEGSRRFDDR
jgi:hypothetical protein